MAYNGDSGMAKRQRTDLDSASQRDHTDSYNKNFEPRRKRPESEPNNVLLFTIINPVYPITVDVLHTICTPNGQVLRIVIFKKNGVQAMVEFDNIDTAKRVKEALNGADIYSGCCTLKIEFAKPNKLNVYKNDMDSWDYTQPAIEKQESQHRQAPLLQEPRFGVAPQLFRVLQTRNFRESSESSPNRDSPQANKPMYQWRSQVPYSRAQTRRGTWSTVLSGTQRSSGGLLQCGGSVQSGGGYMDYEDGSFANGPPSAYGDYVNERYPYPTVDKFITPPITPRMFLDVLASRFMMKGMGGREGLVAPPPPPPPPRGAAYGPTALAANGLQSGGAGCVLMAYGLDPAKANPDRLFNIFCLYGNVIRIKFLKTKEGCAMVQMGDSISVERCINHLKNVPLFGGVLQLGYSKQTYLSEVAQPYTLPDNSLSFKDYTASKNNRYINPSMASKNRIQGPAKILHFFNSPPDLTEEQLSELIEEKEVKKPTQIKFFPKKGDKSSSGLMEFDDLADAVNCLVYCNHLPIKNPESKFPYVMKLCFSSSRSIFYPNGPYKEENTNQQAQQIQQ
ncbi:heterogeneous nuclear ribonucleoprotein L isoform X2 [Rhodnius prolixus]|uniref:heterogeneous nuclear ribonucleoprotein L isoform X2 n=1 Tax=Rhodnius prolixus TaxID=13249 RepID=UPI003D18921D